MPIKYGLEWPNDWNPVQVEMKMIQSGGYVTYGGQKYGEGLFHHYRELQRFLWPEDDHHRWTDLFLQTVLEERITAVNGSRDSGKTHMMARFGLCDYYTFPERTLLLVSSTDLRGLQLRVWGDIKSLHRQALEKWPFLTGTVVESMHGIFTDEITEDCPIRDIRRGLICIPCLDRKGTWVGGLEKFVGIKQERRRVLGDEVQFMHKDYLTILSNLDKGNFKGVFVGNPLPNQKALDVISEPVEGWANHVEPTKTEVFRNRFGGKTIVLVGTDSPNYDSPDDQPSRFSYLIDRQDEKRVAERYGKKSEQYYSQIMGIRKEGLFANRVLTRDLCEQNHAFDTVIWSGEPRTKIYGCDAGFGGDRAVAGWAEFGQNTDGQTVLRFNPPKTIQMEYGTEPEDTIAVFIKREIEAEGIPAANVFFDAGMRATLAVKMAQVVGQEVSAINFGGNPTRRPVSNDEFLVDRDTGQRRLKRCDEAYLKFVTELWFTIRLAVISRQIRELPRDVADEFYQREWTREKGDKVQVETKDDMKKRTGFSPDLADWASIVAEGARRHGFQIAMAGSEETAQSTNDYLALELRRYRDQLRKRTLSH